MTYVFQWANKAEVGWRAGGPAWRSVDQGCGVLWGTAQVRTRVLCAPSCLWYGYRMEGVSLGVIIKALRASSVPYVWVPCGLASGHTQRGWHGIIQPALIVRNITLLLPVCFCAMDSMDMDMEERRAATPMGKEVRRA